MPYDRCRAVTCSMMIEVEAQSICACPRCGWKSREPVITCPTTMRHKSRFRGRSSMKVIHRGKIPASGSDRDRSRVGEDGLCHQMVHDINGRPNFGAILGSRPRQKTSVVLLLFYHHCVINCGGFQCAAVSAGLQGLLMPLPGDEVVSTTLMRHTQEVARAEEELAGLKAAAVQRGDHEIASRRSLEPWDIFKQ